MYVNIIDCVLSNGVVEFRFRWVVFVVYRFGIAISVWDDGFDEAITFSVYPFDECFPMSSL